MNLIFWGFLISVSAGRSPYDILQDLTDSHVKSRSFNHLFQLKSNDNSLNLKNEFDCYDVYSTTNETNESFALLDFNIPLGDIPELRDDFFLSSTTNTYNNNNNTEYEINNLIMELKSIDSSTSKRILGDIYAFGHYGIHPNITLSHEYYQNVINPNITSNYDNDNDDDDISHCHFMLGVFYNSGVLGNHEQNYAKGLIHYELAEDLGSKQATMALAHMYQYGIGVSKNDDIALFYYTKLFNFIEDKLEPFKSDLQLNNGTIRELVNEINFDKFSFRIADLFGGVFPDFISHVRPSLRNFETKELYYHFRKNDNSDDDSLLPQDEVLLNELLLDLYIKTQAYYRGDYLHSRNFEKSMNFALEAINIVKELDIFKQIINDEFNYDKPEWVIYTGRIMLFMSHMYYRGEIGESPNFKLAIEYFELAKKFTTSKLFSTDLSNIYMYGIGNIERDFKKGQKPLLVEKSSISQKYHLIMSNLNLLNDDLILDGKEWSILSYVTSYDYHLSERSMIKFWLNKNYNDIETGDIVHYLANYIKLFEPIFFNFRETFMASINGDLWKSIMGFLIQSELGYEYAQNSLSTILFPTIGEFSNKKYRLNLEIHQNVFTKRRYLEAIKFLEISCLHGNPDSMNHLGDLYYWGLPKNPRPVIGDYNIKSLIWPNEILFNELENKIEMIVPSNPLRSVSLYHDSSNSGSHLGCFNLGWVYEFGIGVSQDLHLSKRYYDLAMSKSKIGYIGIKLSLWRIWFKVKIWELIGFNVEILKVKLGWTNRLFKLLNWKTLRTEYDEL